jgi:hypothetical protein
MNEIELKEEIGLRLVTISARLDLITCDLEDPTYSDDKRTMLTAINALYGVRELVNACQMQVPKR